MSEKLRQTALDAIDRKILALLQEDARLANVELADKVGVTRQTIIAIEQGRYSPSLEMAFQIARAFDVPLDDVFDYPKQG